MEIVVSLGMPPSGWDQLRPDPRCADMTMLFLYSRLSEEHGNSSIAWYAPSGWDQPC